VLRDREKYNEKIPFKERKEKIEKYFKTNVDIILENKRIMSEAERGERDAIDRYCNRELKFEMEPYDWTLVKLPNGKTQAVVVRGRDSINMDKWSAEEEKFKQSKKGIAKRQAIIDSLQIKSGSPKVMWDHGIYSKEEYFELREK
jgi:hypothetical protein